MAIPTDRINGQLAGDALFPRGTDFAHATPVPYGSLGQSLHSMVLLTVFVSAVQRLAEDGEVTGRQATDQLLRHLPADRGPRPSALSPPGQVTGLVELGRSRAAEPSTDGREDGAEHGREDGAEHGLSVGSGVGER